MEESSLSRVWSVLVSPAKTFGSIAERPTWAVPFVLLLVLGALTGVLVTQRVDFEEVTRQSLEEQGRTLTDQQVERIVEFQEKFGTVLGVGNPVVFGAALYLITALLFWIAFKLQGREFSYQTGLATTMHAFMPFAVAAVLNLPVLLSRSELTLDDLRSGGSLLASNLGVLAPEDAGPVLMAALTSCDLFSLWTLVLLSLGFSIVARTSKSAAAVTAVVIWLLGVAAKIGLAALGSLGGS